MGGALDKLIGAFTGQGAKDAAKSIGVAAVVGTASALTAQALADKPSSKDPALQSPASIDEEGQAAAERLRRRRASAAARAQGRPGTILGGTNQGSANVVARQLTG